MNERLETRRSAISSRRSFRARRGAAVFLVLLFLALTMTLAYATIRSQGSGIKVESNFARRQNAKQTAMTGLAIALKKMSQSDWIGADKSFTQSLDGYDYFTASFATGDASLTTASGTSYADYPWRVTVKSTGYSVDPTNANSIAKYSVQAVVRLIPRAVYAEPTDWSDFLTYTVYQTTPDVFMVNMPMQIQGKTRVQWYLNLAEDSGGWSGTPRAQYLDDLVPMYSAGKGDYRLFTSSITCPKTYYYWYFNDLHTALTNMSVTMVNANYQTITSLAPTATPSQYQLYTGGKKYTAVQTALTVTGTTLSSDPKTNPLGIFVAPGSVTLKTNAVINGTLITNWDSSGKISVTGSGVTVTPVTLPTINGETTPLQLPAILSYGQLTINADSQATVNGVVGVNDQFYVTADDQTNVQFTLTGKLFAKRFRVEQRNDWGDFNWSSSYTSFAAQKSAPAGTKYFPEWLVKTKSSQINIQPYIVFKPSSTDMHYHWFDCSQPLFVPLTADGGLRWELVSFDGDGG